MTAFVILFVTSLLRIVGDVALHSHVRALLLEAQEGGEEEQRLEEMGGDALAAVPPLPRGEITTSAASKTVLNGVDVDDPYQTEPPIESKTKDDRSEAKKEYASKWMHSPPLHMLAQYWPY